MYVVPDMGECRRVASIQLLILASVDETPTLDLSLFVARALHQLLLTVMSTGGSMNTCITTK